MKTAFRRPRAGGGYNWQLQQGLRWLVLRPVYPGGSSELSGVGLRIAGSAWTSLTETHQSHLHRVGSCR
jgi:hypothetical protein